MGWRRSCRHTTFLDPAIAKQRGWLYFSCNVVNDRLKHPSDAPTIGLILCQTRDRLLAEYSFAGIDRPIGISTYELTRALPARLKSALPSVEEIEAERGAVVKPKKAGRKRASTAGSSDAVVGGGAGPSGTA